MEDNLQHNEENLSLLEEMSHKHHELWGKVAEEYGHAELKLIDDLLSFAQKIIQTIGVFAGFGFTGILLVKNIYFFVIGESFLISSILYGIYKVKKIYEKNLESIQESSDRKNAIFDEKSKIFQEIIPDFLSKKAINKKDLEKRLAQVDEKILAEFRNTSEKKQDEGKFLNTIIKLSAIGTIILLLSFTSISGVNLIQTKHKSETKQNTQTTTSLPTIPFGGKSQIDQINIVVEGNASQSPYLSGIKDNLKPLSVLGDPLYKQPDFLGAALGSFAAIAAVFLAFYLTNKHEKSLRRTKLTPLRIIHFVQGSNQDLVIYRLQIKNESEHSAREVEADTSELVEDGVRRENFLPAPLGWTNTWASGTPSGKPRAIHPRQIVYLDVYEFKKAAPDNPTMYPASLRLSVQAGAEIADFSALNIGTSTLLLDIFQESGQVVKVKLSTEWDGSNEPNVSILEIRRH